MADVAPKEKPTADDKIAQYLCMIGSIGGERRTGFEFAERDMKIVGRNWSDVGNAYRHYFKHGGSNGDGRFSEAEMQECAQAARAQGVEQGIKIGQAQAQASNGHGNGYVNGNAFCINLPFPGKMAEYCHHHQQLNRMKDNERQFIKEMYAKTLSGVRLKRPTLGYLASLYIKYDGKL